MNEEIIRLLKEYNVLHRNAYIRYNDAIVRMEYEDSSIILDIYYCEYVFTIYSINWEFTKTLLVDPYSISELEPANIKFMHSLLEQFIEDSNTQINIAENSRDITYQKLLAI